MIRNVLVSPCINDISTSLAGADHGMFAEEAEKAFATNLNLFGNEVDFTFMMMYSIGASYFSLSSTLYLQIQFKTQGLIYGR